MSMLFNKYVALSVAVSSGLAANYAAAALQIDPGPGYVLTSGGYRSSTSSVPSNPGMSEASVGGTGLMIGSATFFNPAAAGSNASGTATVANAFVVTPTGYTILNPVTGFTTGGYTPRTINPAGSLITGTATGTSSTGVVWTPDGTSYMLPTPANTASSNGVAANTGVSINNSGTVVGVGNLYSGATLLGSTGFVYFNTASASTPSYTTTTPAQLLPVATSTAAASNQSVAVFGVSPNGTAYGQSSSTTNGTAITGRFATVWNAGNTAGATSVSATALTVAAPSGFTAYNTSGSGGSSSVSALGSANVAVGSAAFFPTGSSTSVTQPVRWTLNSSTAGTILSVPSGYTGGGVNVVNALGDSAGTVTGANPTAAVVWKAGTTTPTMLNRVTTPVVDPGSGASSIAAANTAGTTAYDVRGINDGGYSVGFATQTSSSGTPFDALVWDPNGNVTELNSLVTLTTVASGQAGFVSLVGAYNVTNDGWISGLGVYYDPADTTYAQGSTSPYATYGAGTYFRTFELQDPAVTPEPVGLAGVLMAAGGMLRRRRNV